MQKAIVWLLIFLIPIMGLAQDSTITKRKTVSKKQLKTISREQINQLHDGVLLVRLQTKRNSVAALRKAGKYLLADKVENRQAKYNQLIISGFRKHFDFCPTYFFFSHYSNEIREGSFESVEFLNDSLLHDSTIAISATNFLTAEFGTIEDDEGSYLDGYDPIETEHGAERQASYHGGTNMGFGALIIKSDQFIQLRRPFPFYTRTFDSLPFKRTPAEVVQKMNRKLREFY